MVTNDAYRARVQKRHGVRELVATTSYEPQDLWILAFKTWWDDRITVNSWHGLEEHRPLGSTNRMRRVVYSESRKLRLGVNGLEDVEYVEPGSVGEVPRRVAAPMVEGM